MSRRTTSHGIALAFLDGPWQARALAARGGAVLDTKPRGMRDLAGRVVGAFAEPPAAPTLADFIRDDEFWAHVGTVTVQRWALPPLAARPPPPFDLPALDTVGALADWLDMSVRTLDGLCDLGGVGLRKLAPQLRHYRYHLVPKRSGGRRLLEAPKRRMKQVQRAILDGMLARVPVDDAAHGFVSGRSFVSHARLHVGRPLVVRIDLRDFFLTIGRARVAGLFRWLGYRDEVARRLTALTTNRTPEDALRRWRRATAETAPSFADRSRWRDGHLPQGAPTSPALSNMVAHGLDRRLTALAEACGARYSRYADDLVLSGPPSLRRVVPRVAAVALEEGFEVHHRKTRVMGRAGRQQIGGVVVNERPNLCRRDYERLEATLFNAVRSGPEAQNREGHPDFEAHLRGRIAWVAHLDETKGAKLRALFDRISWSSVDPV